MHPFLMEKIAQARQMELRSQPTDAPRARRSFDLNRRVGWLMVVVGLRLAGRSARRRGALVS